METDSEVAANLLLHVCTLAGFPSSTAGSTRDSLPANSPCGVTGCRDHDGALGVKMLALMKQAGRWQEMEGSLWERGRPSRTSQQETGALKPCSPKELSSTDNPSEVVRALPSLTLR